ncbi:MAG: hypothetical protein IPM29_17435 [Planctomycetes bacterium]|nr:hypothetical protein [Planctomycetota bacterium]
MRAPEIAGVTTDTDGAFMAQFARNLTDHGDGFLRAGRLLIFDPDTKFSRQFERILTDVGMCSVATSNQAADMNAVTGRSVQRECLDRPVLFERGMLRRALREYAVHHNRERPSRGVGNALMPRRPEDGHAGGGDVRETERLGGLLRHYAPVA